MSEHILIIEDDLDIEMCIRDRHYVTYKIFSMKKVATLQRI